MKFAVIFLYKYSAEWKINTWNIKVELKCLRNCLMWKRWCYTAPLTIHIARNSKMASINGSLNFFNSIEETGWITLQTRRKKVNIRCMFFEIIHICFKRCNLESEISRGHFNDINQERVRRFKSRWKILQYKKLQEFHYMQLFSTALRRL